MIYDLRKPDLYKLEVGDIIITSKGYEFMRVDRDGVIGWQDQTTLLLWQNPEPDKMNHYQAMEKFNTPEKRLPTKEEFEEAEKHGFREVLGIKSGYFWSSSVYPYSTAYAFVFYGYDGDVGFDHRYYGDGSAVTICGK